MSENLAPTPERLRRGQWDRPELDQRTQRRTYKQRSIFEDLKRAGHIDQAEFQAAEKYEKHFVGSLGYDCRTSDESNGLSDVECPRTYHSQKIAQAAKVLTDRQSFAIVCLITDCQARLEIIGRQVTAYRDRAQAKAAATQIVQLGLEQLAYLWGLKERKGL